MAIADIVSNTISNPTLNVIPAQAHADIAAGKVIQIDILTGLTSAPADNDTLGFFGIAQSDVASGDIGAFQIRGLAQAMLGDTSAIGTPLNPMSDMMLNGQAVTALTGEAQDINILPAFAKTLELGVDGELKTVLIISQ